MIEDADLCGGVRSVLYGVRSVRVRDAEIWDEKTYHHSHARGDMDEQVRVTEDE